MPTPSTQPTAEPAKQTTEYLNACTNPAILSLDTLEKSVRAFSRDTNAAVQQCGAWQRELRDAQFDEKSPRLVQCLSNCDQRQEALARTLNELARHLNVLRGNIADLRQDHAELERCACRQ